MNPVYITKASKFLPNTPIDNDQMEAFLGKINEAASRAKRVVLRNNGIQTRYYALDTQGNPTHTNADLTCLAIKGLLDTHFKAADIQVLSCGTSTPDCLLPSHAAMVHGLLKGSGAVKSGNSTNAVCTGSERVSSWLRANKYESEIQSLTLLQEQPILAFKKDFLRFMLSDGAGALRLESKPHPTDRSLQILWMEAHSYAHQLEACMYAGCEKQSDGSLKAWSDYSPEQWLEQSIFSIKQDVKLLNENILVKGAESMQAALNKHALSPDEITYFLPHISSLYFKDRLYEELKKVGIDIPLERWFLNLPQVGNVGSASPYLMLEELFNSQKLQKGDTLLLSVPESGRFSYSYALLKVV